MKLKRKSAAHDISNSQLNNKLSHNSIVDAFDIEQSEISQFSPIQLYNKQLDTSLNACLFIDRISTTGPLTPKLHTKFAERIERRRKLFPSLQESRSKDPNYEHSYVFITSGNVSLYLAYKPRRAENNFVKLDMNMSKVEESDLNEMLDFLNSLFGKKFTTIFLSNGSRLTKLEVSLDLFGIGVDQVSVSFKRSRSFHHLKDGSSFCSYKRVGSAHGDSLKVYDKAKEITENMEKNKKLAKIYGFQKSTPPKVTRIELVKKPKQNCNLGTLSKLDLGLERMEIYSVAFLQDVDLPLLYMIDALGISETLNQLPRDNAKWLQEQLTQNKLLLSKESFTVAVQKRLQAIENLFKQL